MSKVHSVARLGGIEIKTRTCSLCRGASKQPVNHTVFYDCAAGYFKPGEEPCFCVPCYAIVEAMTEAARTQLYAPFPRDEAAEARAEARDKS